MWNKIKGALKSRVVWFNAITGTLEIVNMLNGAIIPPQVAATVLIVGNVLLRFVTDKPLENK